MFGNMKNMMQQIQMAQKLMKDENFKAFMAHPKVKSVFADPEFQTVMKSNDAQKIMTHPKLASLKGDPELAELLKKVDFKGLFG